MAMIRLRAAAGSDVNTRLLLSSRGWDDIIYREELERLNGNGLTVVHTLTMSQPPGWAGYTRRVDALTCRRPGDCARARRRVLLDGWLLITQWTGRRYVDTVTASVSRSVTMEADHGAPHPPICAVLAIADLRY